MRLHAKNPSPSRNHSGESLTPETGPGLLRWGARPASPFSPMPTAHYRGTSNVLLTSPTARIVSSAGGLSLAALLALAASSARPPCRRSAIRSSVIVDRQRHRRYSNRRLAYSPGVAVGRQADRVHAGEGRRQLERSSACQPAPGQFVVTRQPPSVGGCLTGGPVASACQAGVCWSTDTLRLPRNGDGRFGVTVRLMQAGSYRLSGAVREASEPFVYESWLVSSARSVVH